MTGRRSSNRRRSIGEWLEEEIDDGPRKTSRSRRRRDDDDEDNRFDAITSAISMLEERLEGATQGGARPGRRQRGSDDLSDVIAQITNQQDALDYQYEGQNVANIQRLQNQVRDLRGVVEAATRGNSFPGLSQDVHALQQQLQNQLIPQPQFHPSYAAQNRASAPSSFNSSLDRQMQALGQRIGLPVPQPDPHLPQAHAPHYEHAHLPIPFRPSQTVLADPSVTSIEALRRDVQMLRNAMRQNLDPRTIQGLQGEIRILSKKIDETPNSGTSRDLQELKAQIVHINRAIQDGGFHANNRFVTAQLQQLNENISRVQRPILPDRLVQDVRTELAEATRKLVPLSIHDAKTLEKNIQFLAERLDSLRARQPDNARLQALEGQIGRLTTQLTQSEQLFNSLSRMEGSFQELSARLSTNAQSGGSTSLDAKSAGILRGFQKQIEEVKATADASDKRMHQALTALQDVMVKVEKTSVQQKPDRSRKQSQDFGQRTHIAPKSAMAAAREAAAKAAEAEEEIIADLPRERIKQETENTERQIKENFATVAKAQVAKGTRKAVGLDLRVDAQSRAVHQFDEAANDSNVTPFRKVKRYASQLALAAAGVVLVIGAYNLLGPLLNEDQTATASISPIEESPAAKGFSIPPSLQKQTAQPALAPPPVQTAALDPSVTPQKLAQNLPSFPSGLTSQKLRTAAQNGDVRAYYEIGSRLIDARGGIERNVGQGLEWLQLAAERQHAPALYRLGALYEKGQGVTRNLPQAVKNYSAAGQLGNRKALHNLGALYASGVDGEPDFNKAFTLFKQAAELGLVDSQYNLAIVYVNGMGVKQDLTEAYKWFAVAAQNGDAESTKKRNEIGSRFDGKTLVKAKLAAQSFKPNALDPAANEDVIPASAWADAAPSADISAIPGAGSGEASGLSIGLPQTAGKP